MSAKSQSVPIPGATANPTTLSAATVTYGLIPDRVIKTAEAVKLTGYSASSLDRLEQEGKFPPRRQLGAFKSGWLLSDLIAWMHTLPQGRPEGRNKSNLWGKTADQQGAGTQQAGAPPRSA